MARRNSTGLASVGLYPSNHGQEGTDSVVKFPIPVLEFKDGTGLEASEFATFRIGQVWSRKVAIGTPVLISLNGMALGVRIVSRLEVGNILDMLARHAINSHLEIDGDKDEALAATRRYHSLVRLYGPHVVNEKKALTVLYLSR
jgi:hypothetical protein